LLPCSRDTRIYLIRLELSGPGFWNYGVGSTRKLLSLNFNKGDMFAVTAALLGPNPSNHLYSNGLKKNLSVGDSRVS
jgi:hypothetical protein